MAEKEATAGKGIDWEAVEMQYRAGIRSLKEIGKEFKVSDAGIIKRAKRDGWTRDLKAKIKAKADAKVSAAAVSEKVSANQKLTEKLVVEANAEAIYRVRIEHRQDIKRTRELFQSLMGEIEGMTAYPELAEQLFELLNDPTEGDDPDKPMSKGEEERHRKMRETFNRIMSSAGRIDSAKKLTEMLEKVIRLERQAFNIEDESGADPQEPGTQTPNDLARRVAFILAKGMKQTGA